MAIRIIVIVIVTVIVIVVSPADAQTGIAARSGKQGSHGLGFQGLRV